MQYSMLRNQPALIEKLLCNYFPFSAILMTHLSLNPSGLVIFFSVFSVNIGYYNKYG